MLRTLVISVALVASLGSAQADTKDCTRAINASTAEIQAIASDFTAKTQELQTVAAHGTDEEKIEAASDGLEWVQGMPDRIARIRADADVAVKAACPSAIHRLFLRTFDKGRDSMLETLKPMLAGD